MHELAICEAILDTVTARADGRSVPRVDVRIGHLRQVVPDSLLFSWEILTQGTDLAGCTLVIEHVPAVVHCLDCAAGTTLDLPILACAACGGFHVELVSGEEFQIASLDVVEAAN